MNEFDNIDAQLYQIMGEEVLDFGCNIFKVTIRVPWDILEPMNQDQIGFVQHRARCVQQYLKKEGYIVPNYSISILVNIQSIHNPL